MRRAFAYEAVLSMEPDADVRAPGAVITTALCGHWEHQPPCPVAPHHTSAERFGVEVHVRTLFIVDPAHEREVRDRLQAALAQGQQWRVLSSGPSAVLPEETEHALRLAQSWFGEGCHARRAYERMFGRSRGVGTPG